MGYRKGVVMKKRKFTYGGRKIKGQDGKREKSIAFLKSIKVGGKDCWHTASYFNGVEGHKNVCLDCGKTLDR